MRTTSLEAWARIQDALPASRAKVLRVIIDHPGLTALEIEKFMGFSGRRSNSRINELEKQGLVFAQGEKVNPETGLRALCWHWTGSTDVIPLPKKEKLKDVLTQLSERVQRLEAQLGVQQ